MTFTPNPNSFLTRAYMASGLITDVLRGDKNMRKEIESTPGLAEWLENIPRDDEHAHPKHVREAVMRGETPPRVTPQQFTEPHATIGADPNGTGTPYGMAALNGELDRMLAATEGTRNDTLNRVAFRIHQLINTGDLAEEYAIGLLEEAAAQTGLGPTEIRRTIRSAHDGAAHNPATRTPSATQIAPIYNANTQPGATPPRATINTVTGEITRDDEPITQHNVRPANTDQFWTARQELVTIRETARARNVSDYALLGEILLRCLDTIPPNVVLPAIIGGYGSLNAFIAVVAQSGGGKGAAASAAEHAIITPDIIPTRPLGSGEGITAAYGTHDGKQWHQTRNAIHWTASEVDTLKALSARTGSTLMGQLRAAFSGEQLGFANANVERKRTLPAHSYRLTLSLGVQPKNARPLLDDEAGGTPQRFLFLPGFKGARGETGLMCPPPIVIPETDWTTVGEPHAITVEGPEDETGLATKLVIHQRVLPIPPDVVQWIVAANDAAQEGETDPLDSHLEFAALKFSQAFAVLAGRTIMTVEDWQLAQHLLTVTRRTRRWIQYVLASEARQASRARGKARAEEEVVVQDRLDKRAVESASSGIVAVLRGGPKTVGMCSKKINSRYRPFFHDALARLEAEGVVSVDGRTLRLTNG